jgi:hypothetical protein
LSLVSFFGEKLATAPFGTFATLSAQSGRCPSMFHNNRKNRVLRVAATTASCDTSEGNPEGAPFAFTDAF